MGPFMFALLMLLGFVGLAFTFDNLDNGRGDGSSDEDDAGGISPGPIVPDEPVSPLDEIMMAGRTPTPEEIEIAAAGGPEAENLRIGGPGNSTIRGSTGDDLILGGPGHDAIFGGAGDDVIYAGSGNDEIYGEAGNDIIHGGLGRDTIYGGGGDDILIGVVVGSNDIDPLAQPDIDQGDLLFGGAGDDLLILGNDDTATGGPGADRFATGFGWIEEGRAATVTDYDPYLDSLEVWFHTSDEAAGPPDVSVRDEGFDAFVIVNGKEVLRVLGAAGQLAASDVQIMYGANVA